jgi:hypothetical protein
MHAEARFYNAFPLNGWSRIKIDHQGIGVLELFDGAVPRMQFDDANVDKTEEAFEIIDPKPRLNLQLVD